MYERYKYFKLGTFLFSLYFIRMMDNFVIEMKKRNETLL